MRIAYIEIDTLTAQYEFAKEKSLELEKKNEPRLYRDRLTQLYTQARQPMEKYRMLVPKDQKRWAPALYRIYLNLNLGQQFEDIDRLMKQ